jgi:hypothetical protein
MAPHPKMEPTMPPADSGIAPAVKFPTPIEEADRDRLRTLLARRADDAAKHAEAASYHARVKTAYDAAKAALDGLQAQREQHRQDLQAHFAGDAKKPAPFNAAGLIQAEDELVAAQAVLDAANQKLSDAAAPLNATNAEIDRVARLIARHQLDQLLARRQEQIAALQKTLDAIQSFNLLLVARYNRSGDVEAAQLAGTIPAFFVEVFPSADGSPEATRMWSDFLDLVRDDPDAELEVGGLTDE